MADIEGALKGVKVTNPLSKVGDYWLEPCEYNIQVIVEPPCKW